MSKNKFEVVDYEDAVRLYGDIEFTFHDYWKHSFRYDNEELGLREYDFILMELCGEYYIDVIDIELGEYNWCNL